MATPITCQPKCNSSIQNENASTLELEDDDLIITTDVNQFSLLCRVFTDKKIKIHIFQSVMATAWGSGFSVRAGPPGLLQIFFNDEFEMFKIFNGAPWQYKRFLVLLRPWEMGYLYTPSNFQFVLFWVQLRGLPDMSVNKHLGTKIGNSIGNVLACEIFNVKDGKLAKVRVNLDIFKPLPRELIVQKGLEIIFKIDYQYESLGHFCPYCGIIGHEKNGCHKFFLDMKSNTVGPCLWGDSLRATEVGVKNYVFSDKNPIKPTTRLSHFAGTSKTANPRFNMIPSSHLEFELNNLSVVSIDACSKRGRNVEKIPQPIATSTETSASLEPVSKKKIQGK